MERPAVPMDSSLNNSQVSIRLCLRAFSKLKEHTQQAAGQTGSGRKLTSPKPPTTEGQKVMDKHPSFLTSSLRRFWGVLTWSIRGAQQAWAPPVHCGILLINTFMLAFVLSPSLHYFLNISSKQVCVLEKPKLKHHATLAFKTMSL